MIKLTYLELRSALPALQKLFQQNFTNMKILLKLRKLLSECERELQAFEDVRLKLVDRFGETTLDENGSEIKKVKDENMKQFEQELQNVFSMQVELQASPITTAELEQASDGVKMELSAIDLKLLDRFIVDEQESLE